MFILVSYYRLVPPASPNACYKFIRDDICLCVFVKGQTGLPVEVQGMPFGVIISSYLNCAFLSLRYCTVHFLIRSNKIDCEAIVTIAHGHSSQASCPDIRYQSDVSSNTAFILDCRCAPSRHL